MTVHDLHSKPFDFVGAVRTFHETFGHPVADRPTDLDEARLDMRLDLIREEFDELVEALQVVDGQVNRTEALDACGDIIYVVIGLCLEMGLPIEGAFEAIQRSNMSKLGADGKPVYREDGKILKGPRYHTPTADIEMMLRESAFAGTRQTEDALRRYLAHSS